MIQNLQVITKPQPVKVGALGIKKEGENFDTPSFQTQRINY